MSPNALSLLDNQSLKLKDTLKSIPIIGIDIDGVLVDTVDACLRKALSQFSTVM
jgi:hypothetical protein